MADPFEDKKRTRDIANIKKGLEFGCMEMLSSDFNPAKRMPLTTVPANIKEAIAYIAPVINYDTAVKVGGKISAHLVRAHNEDSAKSPADLAISALEKSAISEEVITRLKENITEKAKSDAPPYPADAIKARLKASPGSPVIPVRRASVVARSASGRS